MQRMKAKKAPKVQSQRAEPRKQSKKSTRPSMMGLASMKGMSRSNVTSSHRLRDHDLIANISSPVSAAGASLRIPCNPRFWPNTRAYQESLGYQCYCPRSIAVHWRPSVAATSAGQVIGGSLSSQQDINMSLIANAIMSVPGSQAGPVWKEMEFKFDLSMLTQPKYFLNSVDEDGVPADLFLVLPSTAVGLVEVSYDIEFYGHCTAPVTVSVYDIIPRSWTAPAALNVTSGTLNNGTGLVASNNYTATLACNPSIGTNILLQPTSGGGGPTLIDTSYFNSKVDCACASTGNTSLFFYETPGTVTYLSTAAMQGLVTYVWLSGNPN